MEMTNTLIEENGKVRTENRNLLNADCGYKLGYSNDDPASKTQKYKYLRAKLNANTTCTICSNCVNC